MSATIHHLPVPPRNPEPMSSFIRRHAVTPEDMKMADGIAALEAAMNAAVRRSCPAARAALQQAESAAVLAILDASR